MYNYMIFGGLPWINWDYLRNTNNILYIYTTKPLNHIYRVPHKAIIIIIINKINIIYPYIGIIKKWFSGLEWRLIAKTLIHTNTTGSHGIDFRWMTNLDSIVGL